MKLKHLVISGNIGVGKTTLAEKLAKKYNWKILLEEVDNNPYLDDFYKSMKNWSFHLQIFFLNSRFKQIQNISKTNDTIIQDRSIYEDYEVFTKNLFDSGILLKREFENYKRLYDTILEYVKVPDLLIYIRNKNINNIINNIKKR
ncbi:MAG: deoxynucleoside kinase, partial [Bacteroidota bacterium]|nr:deoxynucleoside kinase [Bacteroidota bacterium]